MKLNYVHTHVTTEGSLEKRRATIDLNPTISHILSRDLYQRPVESMFREILINAIDAHVEAGQTKPVDVYIPTIWDEVFYIRDYGNGLSHKDLMDIYLAYGTSSRRDSDAVHGGLGLGTKSPLAYTTSFGVTSWHKGEKNEYLIYYDEDNLPCVDHRSTEIVNEAVEPSGLKVSLTTVSSYDYTQFLDAAKVILPRIPATVYNIVNKNVINQTFTPQEGHKVGDLVLKKGSGLSIIMGYVAYKLDINAILDYLSAKPTEVKLNDNSVNAYSIISKLTTKNHVEVLSEIGKFPVHPSREYVNITPRAIKTLLEVVANSLSTLWAVSSKSLKDDVAKYSLTNVYSGTDWKIRARFVPFTGVYYVDGGVQNQINSYTDLLSTLSKTENETNIAYLSADDMTDFLGGNRRIITKPFNWPSNTNVLAIEKEAFTPQVFLDLVDACYASFDISADIENYRKQREESVTPYGYSQKRVRNVVKSIQDPKHNVLFLGTGNGRNKVNWDSQQHNAKTLKALNKEIFYVPTRMGCATADDAKLIDNFNDIKSSIPSWKMPIIIGLPASKGTKLIEQVCKPLSELEQWINNFKASDYLRRRMLIKITYDRYHRDVEDIKAYGPAAWLDKVAYIYRKFYLHNFYVVHISDVENEGIIQKANLYKEDIDVKFPRPYRYYDQAPRDALQDWAKQVADLTGNKPTGVIR